MGSSDRLSRRYRNEDYISVAMEFRCNLRCVHCMIADSMDFLQPRSEAELQRILAERKSGAPWTGIILTGAEITLHRDLQRWAAQAREAGFSHVRIQTHGMRLADNRYLASLVSAGVDQYFISIAGATATTHDRITGIQGSFDKTVGGLMRLNDYDDVVAITNTVVSRLNYAELPEVVTRLDGALRLTQMEFWGYLPMEDNDHLDLLPRHSEVMPFLHEAVRRVRARRMGVEVKHFPACLLGDERSALVNEQPKLAIDSRFWSEFAKNGFFQCVYRNACASRECLGLTTAYIKKYGDEQDKLRPISEQQPT